MAEPPQIDILLARWLELAREGRTISARALCAELGVEPTDQLIQELERHIHNSWQEDQELVETLALKEDSEENTSREVIYAVTHYDCLRFLAKGGVGEVFRANDKEFGRDVAVKFIQRHQDSDPRTRQQFLVEGEVTARLEHPGIVPVYGLGYTSEGRPFHAMQLIQGETLGDRIDAHQHELKAGLSGSIRSMRFRELLGRFISVCNTIAYAHNRGILHRDIKPSNIMLGKYGETLVVDWGLAKPIPRDERAVASGEKTLSPALSDTVNDSSGGIVGTPAYMSPEQSRDDPNLTPATDIYGLGATLYKLLTGEPSIKGSNLNLVLDTLRNGQFRKPREVNREVPGPLQAICLKAMSLEPKERYVTALDMATDIERWLADEPVSVYAEPFMTKVRRWTQRHRLATQITVVLLLVVVVAVTVWITSSSYQRELMEQQRVNQRKLMLQQRLKDLATNANVQAALLKNGFRDLENDVHLLATRPPIKKAARHLENGKLDSVQQEIEAVFHDFLDLNPNYMQVRLIDKKGFEVVRLHRKTSNGPISKAKKLQFKGNMPYFTDTMQLKANAIYLSRIELNVENGKKQWDFPVIRAAVPLFGSKNKAVGIVIMNMHFQQLTQLVRQAENNRLLVYLTNQKGEFLLHPTPDMAFCFERKLDYDIQSNYPDLEMFLRSEEREIQLTEQRPPNAILIRPKMPGPAAKQTINRVVTELRRQFRGPGVEFSDTGELAVITNIPGNKMDPLLLHMRKVHSKEIEPQPLPPRYRDVSQAVFCRKVYFDRRNSTRFISLVLVLPF